MSLEHRVCPADYKRLKKQVLVLQNNWNADEDCNELELHSLDLWKIGDVHIFAAYFFSEKSSTMQRYMVGFIPKIYSQTAVWLDSNATDLYFRFSKEDVVAKVFKYMDKIAMQLRFSCSDES